MAPTLSTLFRTWLPHRFLFPARRRFRDQPAPRRPGDSRLSFVRLAVFLIGGVLLANLVLITSAMMRAPVPQSKSSMSVKRGAAAEPVQTAPVLATDARATPDGDSPMSSDDERAREITVRTPARAVTKISQACVEQARERLIVGLTHYYMQRMVRPREPSEEASDGAALATLMAGPGDPAASSGRSCAG